MQYIKSQKFKLGFAVVCIAVSFFSVIMIIFKGAGQVYNSDTATALLLANEQIKSKQIFPDGWVYADSIWTLAFNLFVLPFMLFIEDWVLCRNLASILQLILVIGVFVWFSRYISKKYGWLIIVLFLIPLSPTIIEHFFFQATYATQVLWYFLVLVCGFCVLNEKNKRKNRCLAAVLSVFMCLQLILGGYRHILTLIAPLLGSYVIVWYQEWKKNNISRVFRNRYVLNIAFVSLGTALGFSLYLYLSKHVIIEQGASEAMISQGYELYYRLGAAIGNIFTVYGAVDYGTLISVSGVFKFIKTIYCVALVAYVPVSLFQKYHLLNIWQKIFYIYSMLTFALTLYVNVFTDIGHARYYLLIYVNSLVLAVIWLDVIKFDRFIRNTIFIVIALLGLYSYRHYIIYDYSKNVEYVGYYPAIQNKDQIFQLLRNEDLNFGYASYWNAYVITALTNGDIEVLAVDGDSETYINVEPYYWLTNVHWYEPDYHSGRSFLLLSEQEMGWIDQSYIDSAEKIEKCGPYNILIYSYDVLDEEGV